MSTFVLIPGAGGAAWYWHRIVPLLEAAGHRALAIDLPGDDPTAGLSAYADRVVAAIAAAGEEGPVIVVAQSMGGFTAPLVCARARVERLVLLNAMIPLPGETAGEWWEHTGWAEARVAAARAHGYATDFDEASYFLHDVPAEIVAAGASHQRPEARVAFGEPCRFEAWPAIPIRVLSGIGDRFFPVDFQARVARERLGKDCDLLLGGHLLALSNPGGLADRLLKYAVQRLDGDEQSATEPSLPDRRPGSLDALLAKADALGAAGHHDEQRALCDEILARGGEISVPGALARLGAATRGKAAALRALGRPAEAVAACDAWVARLDGHPEVAALEQLGEALRVRADLLLATDPDEGYRALDEVVARLGDRTEPSLRQQAVLALEARATHQEATGRLDGALASRDAFLARWGQSEEPDLQLPIARVLFFRAGLIAALGRLDESLAACDELVARFEGRADPELVGLVARALVEKARQLHRAGRPADARRAFDAIDERFRSLTDPERLEQVAWALRERASSLAEQGLPGESLAALDALIARLEGHPGKTLFDTLLGALRARIALLDQLGQGADAAATRDQLARLTPPASTPG
jgi:tetratricopeptide (TPR) repeat protein